VFSTLPAGSPSRSRVARSGGVGPVWGGGGVAGRGTSILEAPGPPRAGPRRRNDAPALRVVGVRGSRETCRRPCPTQCVGLARGKRAAAFARIGGAALVLASEDDAEIRLARGHHALGGGDPHGLALPARESSRQQDDPVLGADAPGLVQGPHAGGIDRTG